MHSEVVEAGCDILRNSAAVEVFVEEHVVRANQSRVDLQQKEWHTHIKINMTFTEGCLGCIYLPIYIYQPKMIILEDFF